MSLARLQGAYYVATGVWSLVSIRTFEAVTGPKVDRWLVKTVGLLAGVIGATLWRADQRRRVTPEIRQLAVASAVAFGAVDTWYALTGRISRVYLVDAAAQAALLAGWTTDAGRRAQR